MKYAITSALLSAATLSQAASIRHGHSHVHSRRAPAAELEQREAAPAVAYMEAADATALTSKNIKTGINSAFSASQNGVGVGAGGPYQVHLSNKGKQDIVVITWSGSMGSFVGATQPDVTHTLKAGTNTTISFDPSKSGGSVSGAIAPFYPGDSLGFSGQVLNTWLEYTFTNDVFSTTDVSRLPNMKGNKMETFNYGSDEDFKNNNPACASTMSLCSFVCTDPNAVTCGMSPAEVNLQNCPSGAAGNTASKDGKNGGCGGFPNKSGHVQINFYDEKAT